VVLGVDVGGVIIERAGDDDDTSIFGPSYLDTPPVADAFDALAALARAGGRFADAVWLVSKCGPEVERRTREWLAYRRFHERTGIPPERLRFCRTRADKAPIAAALSLTHFVDDRLEVLGYLGSVDHRFLFRPHPDEVARFARLLPQVTVVYGWLELTRLLF